MINIPQLHTELKDKIQYKLDQKAKPIGSLGMLEEIALRLGMMQGTLEPELNNPVMLTVAADHEVVKEGVTPCPAEITWQQCLNFMDGGGGIGLFSHQFGFEHYVVDAGVDFDFKPHKYLIDAKVRKASRNLMHEPAMTMDECKQAIENGRKAVRRFAETGSTVVGFGEMGIGNTTPASALLSVYAGLPVDDCVGPGSGLNTEGVKHKAHVIKTAIKKHGISEEALENLARFGGLEIACIAGGMLEAAAQRMAVLVDGFITTSAAIAATEICPEAANYFFYSHLSNEQGHRKMLAHLNGKPIMQLDLRLGEGTGCALAFPVMQGAVNMINNMTSFDEAAVYNTANEVLKTK